LTRAEKLSPVQALLIPAFATTDGVKLGGLTGGYINRDLGRPVQLRFGYKKIDAGDSTFDQMSIDGKSALVDTSQVEGDQPPPKAPFKLTVLSEFKRTFDRSKQFKAGAALEQTVNSWLTVGATLEYARSMPDDEDVVEAAVPGVGATIAWANSFETSFDYVFKNDVDGEDDYSLTVAQPITKAGARGPLLFLLGVGKHRTIFTTIVVPFR
jgi:hypothetical protein